MGGVNSYIFFIKPSQFQLLFYLAILASEFKLEVWYMQNSEVAQYAKADASELINLTQVWANIVSGKRLIFIITLFFFSLSSVYIFLKKPVYQSDAYITVVEREYVQKLVNWDSVLDRQERYTPEYLFERFKQNISSRSMLRKFFITHIYNASLTNTSLKELASPKKDMDEAFEEFYDGFFIEESSKYSVGHYLLVSLELKFTADKAQALLNDYISQVRNKTRLEVLESIKSEQETRIDQLQRKIRTMKEIAKLQKLDRLAQLDEAIAISRSLNLEEPPELGAKATIQGVASQGLPLYYLGYRLLEAERKVLDERQSNEPFIVGLREAQEQVALLRSYDLGIDDFLSINIDQSASFGEKVKPKTLLVLVFSVMFGLLLGILTAFLMGFLKSLKEKM